MKCVGILLAHLIKDDFSHLVWTDLTAWFARIVAWEANEVKAARDALAQTSNPQGRQCKTR